MDNLPLYEQHLSFMQGVLEIGDIEEKDLLPQFDILLSCIPNGGKLYKYRSLCGQSFEYIYDSLANGYLWLPAARDLNDDYDSVLIEDAEKISRLLADYVTKDKRFGELLLPSLENLRQIMQQFNRTIFSTNENLRDSLHVYSMSESYDLGNMWGYYADSGRGFCVEYDYSRAKALGSTTMRYLLNTFKVNYTDTPPEFPVELLADRILSNRGDPDVVKQILRYVLDRVLTKEKCWENEREWRIVIGNIDCKIPVDIVSAIIIDERALNKANAEKLISLCKKRSWPVKVRKRHTYNTFHSYEDID